MKVVHSNIKADQKSKSLKGESRVPTYEEMLEEMKRIYYKYPIENKKATAVTAAK